MAITRSSIRSSRIKKLESSKQSTGAKFLPVCAETVEWNMQKLLVESQLVPVALTHPLSSKPSLVWPLAPPGRRHYSFGIIYTHEIMVYMFFMSISFANSPP